MKKIFRKDILISIIIIVVAVAFAAGLVAISKSGFKFSNQGNEAVAVVNDVKIRKDDYNKLFTQLIKSQGVDASTIDEETKEEAKKQVLDILVTRELIKQSAEELGISISAEEIKVKVDEIKDSFGSQEELQAALDEGDMVEADLDEIVKMELFAEAVIANEMDSVEFTASDEEVQNAFDDIFSNDDEKPAFSDISGQIKDLIIQQKKQDAIDVLIEKLKNDAEINFLI